jgi:hypothetical protein
MERLKLYLSPRFIALTGSALIALLCAVLILTGETSYWALVPLFVSVFLTAIGVHDVLQTKRSILRNYPISGHARFIMEELRPKIRQYFFEGEKDGRPFPRDKRSLAYQRAKGSSTNAPSARNTMSTSRATSGFRIHWRRHIWQTRTSEFALAVRNARSHTMPRCSTYQR